MKSFSKHWPAATAALAVTTGMSGLFWYWFVVANRYHIFLYNHLGAAPFDERTRSRYWMSGLVAAGIVLLGYSLFNWLAGRIARIGYRHYRPPSWQRMWLLCALPLGTIIVLITATQNRPTLPFPLALSCAAVALLGLAFALMPGALAAEAPGKFLGLTIVGLGATPAFLLLRVVELPGLGLISPLLAYAAAIGGALAGAGWLLGGACILRRRFRQSLRWQEILVSGICWSYLILPLIHHLLLTPPAYRYISLSRNFFAAHPGVQLFCWGAAIALAVITQRVSAACARSGSEMP